MVSLLRVCAFAGCRRTVAKPSRYCDQHRGHEEARRRERQRLSGRDLRLWRRARLAILQRDGYRCRLRLSGCRGVATSVHRLSEHGRFHDENFAAYVSACASCHGKADGGRSRS
jgi:hypothetical protein